VRAVAVLVVVLGLGALGVVGAGSLAQAPPEPPAPPPPTPAPPGAPPPMATSPAAPAPSPAPAPSRTAGPSRPVGRPWHGRLVNGVQLPEVSADWLTWDPVLKQIPNRPWRRWGTAKLIATIERVLADLHAAHPELPQVLVGDLSRPHGGVFDKRFGGLGHASHQNGLDVDVYYPRADHRLRDAWRPDQIDRPLSQELVDRFVAAGVQFVFVGPRTGLHGPPKVVGTLVHHDDHMHVRIFPPQG
jgi:murein endopeptidase